MGSQLKAAIKKIEIVNKATKEEWQQSIRVILGEIELNNENLIALRQFRPDEFVHVSIDAAQLSLEDLKQSQTTKKMQKVTESILGEDSIVTKTEDDAFFIQEGEVPLAEGEVVVEEFKF